ncbi:MAG: hypothetical protein Q9208_002489 [Pyrenodesmia sp. 3 TL-2023]
MNASATSFHSVAGLESATELVRSGSQLSRPGHHQHANQILSQVRDWLWHEKARASKRKSETHAGHSKHGSATGLVKSLVDKAHNSASGHHLGHHRRQSSDASDQALALKELERILSNNLQLEDDNQTVTNDRKPSIGMRKGSIRRVMRKKSTNISSDTDHYQDGDIRVPSAEVILDNSKTMSYNGGAASSQLDLADSGKKAKKEAEAWLQFKNEIVRLAHTLRLKGWRRVPLDRGADIDVERLSGALTNAVYVVSPPRDVSQLLPNAQNSTISLTSKRPPAKLLLRIYGPQVDHLIDRDNELQILRRLARKRIGPRLLGTFSNGRFEEFFEARTLTAEDLRIPETSKHIAKRMRELHDGIELLEEERSAGPFLWQNWDKWVERCEEVILWIDEKMITGKKEVTGPGAEAMKKHGLVCGVEWSTFRTAVEGYRKWLEAQYGGAEGIKNKLVFAHNDVCWVSKYKTEWCYNYHDATKSYALNERRYPSPEEQHRFVKAYVQHQSSRPSLSTRSSSASLRPTLSHSISSFNLDSRAPPAQITEDEKRREEATESEVQRLIHEARMWRPANSAQWVAWGIVQAKVPDMDEALEAKKSSSGDEQGKPELGSGPLSPGMEQKAEDLKDKRPEEGPSGEDDGGEDEFDYLAYARERALLFWGDLLQMGLVKEEELPEALIKRVKVVDY